MNFKFVSVDTNSGQSMGKKSFLVSASWFCLNVGQKVLAFSVEG